MDPYLGEIRMFAGTFAPVDWVMCDGRLLNIAQYNALYALLGTTWGGNGSTTFGVPDLRGRLPIGEGTGTGLSPRPIGASGGASTCTLTMATMPAHNHALNASNQTATASAVTDGAGLAQPVGAAVRYAPPTSSPTNQTLNAMTVTMSEGGSQPHSNLMPYRAINFIICTAGLFPIRP